MRILLVEDYKLLGDGVQAGLAQAGCSVDWVKDGVAADLALKTGEYAAVVLDLGFLRLSLLGLPRRPRGPGDTGAGRPIRPPFATTRPTVSKGKSGTVFEDADSAGRG